MNSKILCLIAGLTLSASLTACSSNPASNNQVAPDASGVSSTTQPGDAMSKDHPGGAMSKDHPGDAMSKDHPGGAMSKDHPGDAMSKDHPGGAMKQSPAPSKP